MQQKEKYKCRQEWMDELTKIPTAAILPDLPSARKK